MSSELEDFVRRELDRLGFDLFEFRVGGSRSRPVLDVRIDRRDGQPVTVEDTATASRALRDAPFGVAADEGGEIATLGDTYGFEVSSPGMERPLKTAAHWRRFVGRRAKVSSPALGGREEVEIVGVEGEEGGETVVLRTDKGEERRVPLTEVKEARLAFHW